MTRFHHLAGTTALLLTIAATAPAQTLTLESVSPEAFSLFGSQVSGIPDVDGDGLGDVVVGASEEDALGIPQAGRAYIFSGATGALHATLISPTPATAEFFGSSLAGLPDVTGDSVVDLVVGAFGAGRAYIISGATGGLFQTLVSPNGQAGGLFGAIVSAVPDVDGDTEADVVVGATAEEPGGSPDNAGRAYLFSGTTGAHIRTLISPAEDLSGRFGTVAGIEDLNGDNRGDVVVGARGEDPGGSPDEAGRVHLISGATGALIRTLVSPNEEPGGEFGATVGVVPDVDGDGLDDVVVGAPFEDPGASPDQAGRAHIFSSATGSLLRTLVSPNEETDGHFGDSVAGLPDVNADGWGDVVVGAENESPGGLFRAGRAYVFSGRTGALLRTLVSPNAEGAGDFSGPRHGGVAGVPDANGDGLGDVVVGATSEGVGAVQDAGRAYIFLGVVTGVEGWEIYR